MHASYATVEQRPTLQFERRLAHPVQAVWAALTEPAELAEWFPCQVEVDLRIGGSMTFRFSQSPPADPPLTLVGEVTELDPPRTFSFLWGEDHLHFRLEPVDDGAGCLLHFTVELDSHNKAARDAAGWHVCLDALERTLGGDAVERPFDPHGWRQRYDEYQERGFPAGAAIPGQE